jgi:hypothetical protein
METMKSLPPQMTLAAPATTQSTGVSRKCVNLGVKALKEVAHGYVEAAQYNAFWIGCPEGYAKQHRA